MSIETAAPEVSQLEFQKMDVLDRLAKVESMLTTADPMLPVHMKHIHANLQKFEELIHILDDDKIHVLMAGMQRFRNLSLAKEVATKKRVSLKNTSVDDL
jgi:hypothetical protein